MSTSSADKIHRKEMSLTRIHSYEEPSVAGERALKQLPPAAVAAPGRSIETTQKGYADELQIPLPPCPFPPPVRSSSRRRTRAWEDPFLAAYMECTKVEDKGLYRWKKGFRGGMSLFSCKRSNEVTEGNLRRSVSTSSLLLPATRKDKFDMN